MSGFDERMRKTYGATEEIKPSSSWIPKRLYRKGDLQSEIKSQTPKDVGIGQHRAQEVLQYEQILAEAKLDIFEQVAEYLLERYGDAGLEGRLGKFSQSWEELSLTYGTDLVVALGGMTDDLDDNPFVKHTGVLNKVVVREAVRQLGIRRKNQ